MYYSMKVLFISKGIPIFGISPVVKNQAQTLKEKGVELYYFKTNARGKGLLGYIRNIPKLRRHLKNNNYDIIHAHYSLTAFTASLAGAKPLVVSLMGSDVKSGRFYRYIINFFRKHNWYRTIVKSEDMRNSLVVEGVDVIPNGVDFNKFIPIARNLALKKTNWNKNKKHILFAGNPNRSVKNYKLAKEAFNLLDDKNIELHFLDNVPNKKMPYYYNAADSIVLTSFWEGSPNVIKEAMACDTPIVSVDVGDVKSVIDLTKGCYISSYNSKDIANKLKSAISFGKTNGRTTITNLDSRIIADKIILLYNDVLKKI